MTDDRTLGDADHTHKYTDRTFGGIYRRGPVATDGGDVAGPTVGDDDPESAGPEADGADADTDAEPEADADRDGDRDRLADVDHTPREGAADPNEIWTRGGEQR